MRRCLCEERGHHIGVSIGGGRDYTKLSYNSFHSFRLREIEVEATVYDLEEDWKNNTNKYGVIRS